MNFSSGYIYDLLKAKGIDNLHHANSVATSCHFLRHGSLMSRGNIERLGLRQTPQRSDAIDRQYRIWNDIFMDSVDIHNRIRDINLYGPVLFVINIDLILELKYLSITKFNPTKWRGKTSRQRWFFSKSELEDNLSIGDFNHMIVAKYCNEGLPFGDFLEKIILDDPDHLIKPERRDPQTVDTYSMAFGALRLAIEDSEINIPVERRTCRAGCYCTESWTKYPLRLSKMFDPRQ